MMKPERAKCRYLEQLRLQNWARHRPGRDRLARTVPGSALLAHECRERCRYAPRATADAATQRQLARAAATQTATQSTPYPFEARAQAAPAAPTSLDHVHHPGTQTEATALAETTHQFHFRVLDQARPKTRVPRARRTHPRRRPREWAVRGHPFVSRLGISGAGRGALIDGH